MKSPAAILDFETTDKDARTCHPVQLAIVDMHSEAPILNTLLKPGEMISKEAAKIHGITQEMVKHAPSPADIQEGVFEALDSYDVIVGYNADHFDFRILERFFPDAAAKPRIDLFRWLLLHSYDMTGYKLGQVYSSLFQDYDEEQAHGAHYDCVMVARVLKKVLKDVTIEEMIHQLKQPVKYRIMPFGKFSGARIEKIPRNYIRYMLSLPDLSKDLRYTFQLELDRRVSRQRKLFG